MNILIECVLLKCQRSFLLLCGFYLEALESTQKLYHYNNIIMFEKKIIMFEQKIIQERTFQKVVFVISMNIQASF